MNDKTKLKEGDQFFMGRIACTVTQTATFSGELHYGFTYVKDSGPETLTQYGCGWMPVYFVENFTGFFQPQAKSNVTLEEAMAVREIALKDGDKKLVAQCDAKIQSLSK